MQKLRYPWCRMKLKNVYCLRNQQCLCAEEFHQMYFRLKLNFKDVVRPATLRKQTNIKTNNQTKFCKIQIEIAPLEISKVFLAGWTYAATYVHVNSQEYSISI